MKLNKYNVAIDAAAATSTDNIALIDQYLCVGTALTTRQPVCRLLDIINGTFKKTAATAEVLRVQDVTFVGTANSTTYIIYIEQLNPMTEEMVSQNFIYTTDATATVTATIIAAAFVSIINANDRFNITASNVAGVMTLTAQAGYPVFTVKSIQSPSGGITVAAAATAGTVSQGFTPYYNMLREGMILGGTGIYGFSGATLGYTWYTFEYYYRTIGENDAKHTKECNIFINLDDAQAAALVTAADAIFALAAYNQELVQVA